VNLFFDLAAEFPVIYGLYLFDFYNKMIVNGLGVPLSEIE